jgi:hypothetical protein
MTAAHASQIIDGYLRRLDAEMSNLPPGRRKELHGQIAEHIDQARSELAEETDADLLTILDRLGEPDEIVAAARTTLALPAGNPSPLEIVALVLIGVGGVVLPLLPVHSSPPSTRHSSAHRSTNPVMCRWRAGRAAEAFTEPSDTQLELRCSPPRP